jgi:type VI secretion system protein ImpM
LDAERDRVGVEQVRTEFFTQGRPVEVGLFGKLPSHGDFLRRRVSDPFVEAWDNWLRECLPASRNVLGERWLDLYLTSPAWRFIGAAGACGPAPVLGVMVPSVDRVGRYFPLTLVAPLPAEINPIAAAAGSAAFFDRAERLIIETLATDDIDFEDFDAEVVLLGEALESIVPPRVVLDAAGAAVLGDAPLLWQMPIGSTADIGTVFTQLLAERLSAVHEPLMLWWTEGSSAVEPSCLIAKGLPHSNTFVALLDGAWAQSGWRPLAGRVDTGATVEMRVDSAVPVGFRSAAASDVGLVRKINEDSFVERSEVGVWAVADGLGGHRDGEVASRMVCDALADLVPDPTFERTIDAVRQRLQSVNDYLLRTGTHAALADRSASTVVALLVRGNSCAVLWAGDSRVYRWRGGKLERLTRDHSPDNAQGPGSQETSNAITRAVGVQTTLSLDLLREKAVAGDRFLLCSDGLTRTVPEAQIEALMERADISIVVQDLISATLAAGAPDNVTVLIAEAFADHD